MAMHSLASVSTPPCSPLSTRRGGNPSNKLLTVTRAVPPSPTTKKPIEKKSRKNLGPGCGLLDWVRLGKSGKDLTGVNGASLCVTEEELAKHCTMDDAWTAIRGKRLVRLLFCFVFFVFFLGGGGGGGGGGGEWSNGQVQSWAISLHVGVVYNITFYMKFHPGGKEELMEGAGKDCTLLFDEVSDKKSIAAIWSQPCVNCVGS